LSTAEAARSRESGSASHAIELAAGGAAMRVSLAGFAPALLLITFAVLAIGTWREAHVREYGRETLPVFLTYFNLDGENNVCPWWESSLMLIAALLLFAVARGMAKGRVRLGWCALGLLMLYFSLDESVGLHEKVNGWVAPYVRATGALTFPWVVPATVFVIAAGFAFLPFLRALPRRTAIEFFASGAIFIAGALGMEFAAGSAATRFSNTSWPYSMTVIAEESLEMIGMCLFIWAIVRHIARAGTPSAIR